MISIYIICCETYCQVQEFYFKKHMLFEGRQTDRKMLHQQENLFIFYLHHFQIELFMTRIYYDKWRKTVFFSLLGR